MDIVACFNIDLITVVKKSNYRPLKYSLIVHKIYNVREKDR
jgi:hypothetical protein